MRLEISLRSMIFLRSEARWLSSSSGLRIFFDKDGFAACDSFVGGGSGAGGFVVLGSC